MAKAKTKPTPAALFDGAPMMLAIDQLRESPTNPRKTFHDGKLAELAESIKSQGLLSPILARPIADDPHDTHEIVFGHRRARATRLAGLAQIPAIVREMSDEAAAMAQLHENLEREDVHPVEEGDAYARLMQEHGATVKQLMADTGKSRTYIYNRLKLVDLGAEARSAAMDGVIDAEMATMIARVPAPLQAEALKRVTFLDPSTEGGPTRKSISLREARQRLAAEFTVALADAAFIIEADGLVPKVGPCTACPRNSSNAPALESLGPLVCTDVPCFEAKEAATEAARINQARAQGRVIEGEAAAAIAGKLDTSGWMPLHRHCWAGTAAGQYMHMDYDDAIAHLAEHKVATPATTLIDIGNGTFRDCITADQAKTVRDAICRMYSTAPDTAADTPSTAARGDSGAANAGDDGQAADPMADWTPAERAMADDLVVHNIKAAMMRAAFTATRVADDLRLILHRELRLAGDFGGAGHALGFTRAFEQACDAAEAAGADTPDEAQFLRGWVDGATPDHLAGLLVAIALDDVVGHGAAEFGPRANATELCTLAKRFGVDPVAASTPQEQMDGAGFAVERDPRTLAMFSQAAAK